jgi:large subunit ribosomal protein L22
VRKIIASAAANAKNLHNVEAAQLFVRDIRVDEGPMYRYFKPGAMGRADIQRKRLSHISVVLESIEQKKEV